MKKILYIIYFLAIASLLFSAFKLYTGCGTKYCAVSGCPREVVAFGSDYCTLHKCSNSSCKNRGSMLDSYSYCYECIGRGK